MAKRCYFKLPRILVQNKKSRYFFYFPSGHRPSYRGADTRLHLSGHGDQPPDPGVPEIRRGQVGRRDQRNEDQEDHNTMWKC